MKKHILICLIVVLVTAWVLPATASNLNDVKKQKDTIDKKITDISKQKQQEQKNLKAAAQEEQKLLKAQAEEDKIRQQLLDELKQINESIEQIDGCIKEAEEKYSHQKELFKVRLRVMYENSFNSYLQTLIEAKTLSDFLARLEYISRISSRDKQTIELLNAAKEDIEYKKRLKEDEKAGIQRQAVDKQKKIEQLQVSRAGLEEEIKKRKKRLAQLEKEEDDFLKKSKELNNEIKKLLQSSRKYTDGAMKWPVPSSSVISSGYGMRVHPILRKKRMHTGIDISGKSGVAILAAKNGAVIVSGWMNGYGNTVVIDHGGGYATLYAHCSKLLVSVGKEVKSGDTIAKVGSTGLSTGPHLHFEVRKNGETDDPVKYFNK